MRVSERSSKGHCYIRQVELVPLSDQDASQTAGLSLRWQWNALKFLAKELLGRKIVSGPVSGFYLPDPDLDKWLEEKYEINYYVNI